MSICLLLEPTSAAPPESPVALKQAEHEFPGGPRSARFQVCLSEVEIIRSIHVEGARGSLVYTREWRGISIPLTR